MLKRVFDFKEAIKIFMAGKRKLTALFDDQEWLSDFGFLTDLTLHLNKLNEWLQGKENFINNLYDNIKSFEAKLNLWKMQLQKKDLTHFPHLSTCKYVRWTNIYP